MALTGVLSAGWRQFLNALQPDYRQRLIEVLRDEYVDEAKDVVQFEEHARRLPYPHFRERLLRIAEEEKAHVKWLKEQITALGGEIPQTTFTVKNGKNSWEGLLMDVEEEKRDCTALWWYNQIPQPEIDIESAGDSWCTSMIETIQSELNLEKGSRLLPLAFDDFVKRDFRMSKQSPVFGVKCYPRGEVPDVVLGAIK